MRLNLYTINHDIVYFRRNFFVFPGKMEGKLFFCYEVFPEINLMNLFTQYEYLLIILKPLLRN